MENQINMENQHRSYYAIIPACVRYDKCLPANAKLLYAEITALANEYGYCCNSNGYFSKLYKVSKETVSRWISKLNALGYIKIDEILTQNGVQERRIYIADPLTEMSIPLGKNVNTPLTKKSIPLDKKNNHYIYSNNNNNIYIYNNKINNNNIYKENCNFSKKFWDTWELLLKEPKWKIKSENALQLSFKKLISLSGNNENTAIEIVERTIANNYQGIWYNHENNKHLPKNNDKPQMVY